MSKPETKPASKSRKKKPVEIQAYDSFRELGPGLFTLDGEWHGSSLRRRMTILKLKSGQLLIHSPIRLLKEDYAILDALGEVNWIIVPNHFHGSEAHFYKRRYPPARLYVSQGATHEVAKVAEMDGILPESWDRALAKEVECLEFEGTRMLHEVVLFHRASRTLIVTDLVFNMTKEVRGAEKIFQRLNQIHQRFGPSRIFRHVFVNHLNRARTSFHKIMEWDFDRVIMNHGEIIETGGKERMRQAFSEMGLT